MISIFMYSAPLSWMMSWLIPWVYNSEPAIIIIFGAVRSSWGDNSEDRPMYIDFADVKPSATSKVLLSNTGDWVENVCRLEFLADYFLMPLV